MKTLKSEYRRRYTSVPIERTRIKILFGLCPLAEKLKLVTKIVSIEEAKAARAGRKRVRLRKSGANILSPIKIKKFELWLKETCSEISKSEF